MTPSLDELITRRRRFTADEARARKAEQCRRHTRARALAMRALARLYPDQFAALLEQAWVKVNAERGPLPGDDDE